MASTNCGKVAIVGVGCVGSTIAHTLMMGGVVSELVLIDQDKDRADGHMLDLMHGAQFTSSNPTICSGNDYQLLSDAHIVIIAAGKAQSVGQSRDELLCENSKVFKKIVPQIIHYNPSCILLVVTNPLDVMTYLAWKLSGFPANRVIGSGTVLDSARLRYQLSLELKVASTDVHVDMLGQHGPFAFAWWSGATIAGQPLSDSLNLDELVRENLVKKVHESAGSIIEKKGSTYFGIALVVAQIVHSIIQDQSKVFAVSTIFDSYQGFNGIAFSLPAIVRSSGVEKVLEPQLNQQEQEHLRKAANHIDGGIARAMTILGLSR